MSSLINNIIRIISKDIKINAKRMEIIKISIQHSLYAINYPLFVFMCLFYEEGKEMEATQEWSMKKTFPFPTIFFFFYQAHPNCVCVQFFLEMFLVNFYNDKGRRRMLNFHMK